RRRRRRRDLVRRRVADQPQQGDRPRPRLPGDPAGGSEQAYDGTGPRHTPAPVPLVVVIGNLTIDDVVLPDGTTHMASLGGNSAHAPPAVLAGGARAAVVARRGDDFPASAVAVLADHGIDVSG